jgi:hypothetical protein
MKKKSYYGTNVLEELKTAIDCLCEAYGRCTPTDVLRLAGIEETNITRQIVLDVANRERYDIKSSGRGYKISA